MNGHSLSYINRELRDLFAARLADASSGKTTLDDVLDWLTTVERENRDHGFQNAADWLIRLYGSDESTAGERITRSFFKLDESRVLMEFLRSDQKQFPFRL